MDLDSSTVMTPSWPTFSMASAMSLPISSSPEEIVATWAVASFVSTFLALFLISDTSLSTAVWMPFLMIIGLAPATTLRMPSWIMA